MKTPEEEYRKAFDIWEGVATKTLLSVSLFALFVFFCATPLLFWAIIAVTTLIGVLYVYESIKYKEQEK
jgi:hypothetical protein